MSPGVLGLVLERIFARMSPRKREVLALYELEGLSGPEIAERVGCPLPTVWTRLHHARRDFQKLSRKLGYAEDEVMACPFFRAGRRALRRHCRARAGCPRRIRG